jgi:hypothetical protein
MVNQVDYRDPMRGSQSPEIACKALHHGGTPSDHLKRVKDASGRKFTRPLKCRPRLVRDLLAQLPSSRFRQRFLTCCGIGPMPMGSPARMIRTPGVAAHCAALRAGRNKGQTRVRRPERKTWFRAPRLVLLVATNEGRCIGTFFCGRWAGCIESDPQSLREACRSAGPATLRRRNCELPQIGRVCLCRNNDLVGDRCFGSQSCY